MDKTKTAVILSIVIIVLLGVVIFLNRDKFVSSPAAEVAPAAEEAAE